MIKLKSKVQKLVDPAFNYTANVFFEFTHWHMSNSGYIAEFRYFYEEGEGENKTEKTISYLAFNRHVSFDQVNAIASTITRDPNLNYVQEEIRFLTFGALAIIGTDKPFGLTAEDWDIIEE